MKNIIRIKFIDFDPCCKKWFINLLRSFNFNIEEVNKSPDIIIFSVFGKYQHSYFRRNIIDCNVKKIFYTGERYSKRRRRKIVKDADLNLTFQHLSSYNNIRLPLWILYSPKKDAKLIKENKSKFCCFVYSHNVDFRNNFCKKLSKYKLVDCGGKCLNNIGCRVNNKIEFQKKYKFCIAYENQLMDGYTTEKILEAYKSNCIPIYYGSKSVNLDFNPETYIDRNNFNSDDELIEYIIKVDNDNDLYESYLNKSIYSKKYFDILNDENNNYFKLIAKNITNNLDNLNINNEFDKIKNRLLRNEYFTFVRFGDGEMNYLENNDFNAPDHTIKKGDLYIELVTLMKKSLEFKKENYYIGIPCGCCEYRDNFRKRLYENYSINKSNLTFSWLFGNGLYLRFKNEIIPILKNYPIILVSNKRTNIKRMKDQGFNIIKWFSVDYNAWKNYQEIIDQVTNYQKEQNIVNHLFIFCAGPISNVLAYQLVQQEDKNIYLDIGSSLDEQLGLGKGTRNYNSLFGWKSISTCYWNRPLHWYQISCDSKEKSKLFRTFLRILAFFIKIFNYIYYKWLKY